MASETSAEATFSTAMPAAVVDSYGDMMFLITLPLAYLIGSIPFGLLIAKLYGYGDIRQKGSGNIGATNVLRTGGKKLAAITLFFDAFKGALPIIIYFTVLPSLFGQFYSKNVAYHTVIGLTAILGHCFPIWLKFKGGKGVATTLGALLAAVPYAGLAACATWLLMAFTFKYSSLSALIAVAVAPVVTYFAYGAHPAVICAVIALLVWGRHHANIKRLLKGEEPKIGSKKKNKEKDPSGGEAV